MAHKIDIRFEKVQHGGAGSKVFNIVRASVTEEEGDPPLFSSESVLPMRFYFMSSSSPSFRSSFISLVYYAIGDWA